MREIKFRAWDKKSKKMRAVNSIAFHNENGCFDFNNSHLPKVVNLWGRDCIEDKDIIIHRESDECELMQFTGLKDRNGKEIYEGDHVINDSGRICEVVYFVSPEHCGFDLKPVNDKGVWNKKWHLWDCTIIGNIHDK